MFGKRLGLFFLFLFFTPFAQGQLSNFNLTITSTNETCTNNGALTFTVSNTTAGATMLYSIFLLPDITTPISVQSGTSISGLAAGNYMVVATQSLGNDSGTQSRDAIITNLRNPLTYQLSSTNEICGNDGTITVSATNGTPLRYEIIAGPMTRASQTSNVFTGLTAGVYQVRAFDACNDGVVQTYTLQRSDPRLNPTLNTPSLSGCASVGIGFTIATLMAPPVGVIKYPIQVTTTFNPPSGPPVVTIQTITDGVTFGALVTYYPGQISSYSFAITDGCNANYTLSGTIPILTIAPPRHSLSPQDCAHQQLAFSSISALVMTAAPVGFGVPAPHIYTPQINNNYINIMGLTEGTYVFAVTDVCGRVETVTIEVDIDENAVPPFAIISNQTCIDGTFNVYEITGIELISGPTTFPIALPHDYTSIINAANYVVFVNMPIGTYVFNVIDRCGIERPLVVVVAPQALSPVLTVLEGCDEGFGSIQLNGQFSTISLTSAPAAYGASLPLNLLTSLTSNGTRLNLGNLPPGIYIFQSTNACGNSFTTTATISGYSQSTNVTIMPNCGSFNLLLNHTSNNNGGALFWLQKFDTVTNTWGHPLTNAGYSDGTLPNATNSFELNLNAITYNMAFSGHFRILKVYGGYVNGAPAPTNCIKNVHEFDFSDMPRINDVYSVSCGSTYEVVVDAVGNSALTYRIITRNGQPFVVQNGASSIFTGLTPAVYLFQVEDLCHNTVNSLFEVASPNPMTITATPIPCSGGSVTLTVPNFSFLTYQWWKGTNTTTILSTTNSLSFPTFNAVTDVGVYHVRISYAGNPNSCLNQVLDYTIPPTSVTAPQAGNDNTVPYCGRQGVVDLAFLLTGTFDATGVWTEVTTSGTLTNHSWDSSTVPFGTYRFLYTVTGTCSQVDTASITITIREIPGIPVASADPVVCESENLNLFATPVASATYHWSGPNGFTSALQNPTISSVTPDANGVYTVYSEGNSCQSGTSTVSVLVNPEPDFELNQDCVGREYQLWVTRLNQISFDEVNSTYSWVGPNGFTSNESSITITGGASGIYTLTITNEFGCDATNFIEVNRTNCFIPNVITPNNDESNESFDLTGFDVSKLEIYNRWGRKVYEKNDYLDEWHGQSTNGGLLPDSTYYYIIKMGIEQEETKTGWIFLNRG